jgi:sRNA-binding protein
MARAATEAEGQVDPDIRDAALQCARCIGGEESVAQRLLNSATFYRENRYMFQLQVSATEIGLMDGWHSGGTLGVELDAARRQIAELKAELSEFEREDRCGIELAAEHRDKRETAENRVKELEATCAAMREAFDHCEKSVDRNNVFVQHSSKTHFAVVGCRWEKLKEAMKTDAELIEEMEEKGVLGRPVPRVEDTHSTRPPASSAGADGPQPPDELVDTGTAFQSKRRWICPECKARNEGPADEPGSWSCFKCGYRQPGPASKAGLPPVSSTSTRSDGGMDDGI